MIVIHNEYETIVCAVGPHSPDYIERCPAWVLHDDGSFSRQLGQNYFRSKPGKLRKPRSEFTLLELQEIIHQNKTW